MHLRVLLFAVLSTLLLGCHGGRILAIFQSQSKSSFLAYEPLVRELAARGHHVTVVGSFPRNKAGANYTDIFVPIMGAKTRDTAAKDTPTPDEGLKRCRHILRHKPVKKLIHSTDTTFDLILVEFPHHQCFLGFAHKHNGSSLIGLVAGGGDPSAHDLLGNTSPYSYVPHPLAATSGDHMTFTQRLTNAVTSLTARMRAHADDGEYNALLGEYFGRFRPLPSVAELQARMTFVFFNNDVSLGYPRPLLPNMADVAGLHIRPPRKLTKDLQTFLDSAPAAGVVVVDMGSHPSQSIDLKLQHAFSKLKQAVLWKRDDRLEGHTPNVRVKKSLPLVDVLAHPKVRALVTHGDLLGIQDAVYHAVPMVGIPLEPGHAHNMHRAQDLGFAIQLDEGNVTSESVQWAVDTIIGDTSYKRSARAVSELFRDQPTAPLEKAVYWTEYVMRYHGARHLQSTARDMPWYQYLLLDVIALLALGAILAAWLGYKAYDYLFGYDDVTPVASVEEDKKLN